MAIYVLEAYNTDSRYRTDIRYREYTASKRRADLFNKIPKIQFSDSGHGIVFSATEHRGRREPRKTELSSYVMEQMAKLIPKKVSKPNKQSLLYMLRKITGSKCMRPVVGGNPPFEWAISDKTMQEALAMLSNLEA